MAEGERSERWERELQALERRVEALVARCLELEEENRLLKATQAALDAERSRLARKNDLARARVESALMRLKAMEREP
ncbi:MAG: TIGR02449 family protein [Gammaproteobacteria bacterium]|nr:MAG: TIGR02449 family protein [Gammaproteobacteria bacterium]